jgi:hypothetical protein
MNWFTKIFQFTVSQEAKAFFSFSQKIDFALGEADLKKSRMEAANRMREHRGEAPAYGEESFKALLEDLHVACDKAKLEYGREKS